jgi:hypothetical protein
VPASALDDAAVPEASAGAGGRRDRGHRAGELTGWVLLAWLVASYVARFEEPDLHVFLRAGAAVWHGASPYPPLGSPAAHSTSTYYYPYVTAWVFGPLAALPDAVAVALFTAVSVLAVVWSCRLAGRTGLTDAALVLLAATTLVGFQDGTINGLLLAGMMACWRLRDNPRGAGIAMAALVVAKLFLAPLVIWLLLTRRYRAAAWAGGLSAGLIGSGWLIDRLGPVGYVRLLHGFSGSVAHRTYSLTAAYQRMGAAATLATVAAAATALAVVGAAWWAAWRGHDERLLYTAGVAVALLATPVVWAHYLLLATAPLLLLDGTTVLLAGYFVLSWFIVTPPNSTGPRSLLGPHGLDLDPAVYRTMPLVLTQAGLAAMVGVAWRRTRPRTAAPAPA